ncbi:hypothetical protein [Geobacter sp.]|uniref:hypothetical protein n=1 Tax=Geobacter sp. TaxID=46610 RepID=UPI0026174B39|nr:hypothetical protein [Geobacter sp.]
MAGTKGMRHTKNRTNSLRRRIWRAMKIMDKGFTLYGLCSVVQGADYGNVRKFVAGLAAHGIVAKLPGYKGGRPVECQGYRLIKWNGPNYPTVCDICGQPMSVKVCDPSLKEKEKEKETETATAPAVEGAREINHDAV